MRLIICTGIIAFLGLLSGKSGIAQTPATQPYNRQEVMIQMRDGVTLLADVHRPATSGRYPVLIAASPYPRQIQDLGAPMG